MPPLWEARPPARDNRMGISPIGRCYLSDQEIERENLKKLTAKAMTESADPAMDVVEKALLANVSGEIDNAEMIAVIAGVGLGLGNAFSALIALLESMAKGNSAEAQAAKYCLALVNNSYAESLAAKRKTVPGAWRKV